MNLPIVKIGNPLLRTKIGPAPFLKWQKKTLERFLRKMVATMRHAMGVGLAANQVGAGARCFVMECRGNKRYPRRPSFSLQAYLNPRIVTYSKEKNSDWEGCLSVPGFRGKVTRSNRVTLEALTPDGRKVRKTLRGFEARVVQHEVDHLNGLFYIDRMGDFKTWTHLEEFNRRFHIHIRDRKK